MNMDIESVVENGVSKSSAVVFHDVGFKIKTTKRFWQKSSDGDSQVILQDVSGALRPGRLTFILGPSGAGKTSLLNILAGRKKSGVTGTWHGTGRNVVLVGQHATLISGLTAAETLDFAARLKLPNVKLRERRHAIEEVSQQLGINEVMDTMAGRLSGGERKRLNIACELLTDPKIMLLDEPTSGLDSVSSLSVARSILAVARTGRTVACVIHQPSSKLFALADDVILLANGRTLYAGAVNNLPECLARAGFECPQYYNMADYLLEIAANEIKGNVAILERDSKIYTCQIKEDSKTYIQEKTMNGVLKSPEAESLLSSESNDSNGYIASRRQQMIALLWRGYKGSLRDVHLSQIRIAVHFIVALLLGALFHGAGAEADRMLSNTGCLFFFLLFLFFANAMPTINTFPAEAAVVTQEHLNKWYSLPIYCFSKILVDLPAQLLCATLFVIPAWYLTSQPPEPYRLGLAWLISILLTILAQTFGLAVGAAFEVKLGLFAIPAANIPMLMFAEFFIPYREIPSYLQPFAKISYFRYSFDAMLQTVYGFGRKKLPCHKVFCMFKNPADLLNYLGVPQDIYSDIWALLLWIWILQISVICILALRVYKSCR